MPEQTLEGVQRQPGLGHVRREGVAEGMGVDPRRARCLPRPLADRDPGSIAEGLAEAAPPEVDEHPVVRQCRRPLQADVLGERQDRLLGDGDQARRACLGRSHGQGPLAPLDVAEAEREQLVDAEPAVFQQPDDGPITLSRRSQTGDEAVDLLRGEHLRERVVVAEQGGRPGHDPCPRAQRAAARDRDAPYPGLLGIQGEVPVPLPHGRQPPHDGAWADAPPRPGASARARRGRTRAWSGGAPRMGGRRPPRRT